MNIPFINTELPDVIELRNVSQTYNGENYILKDVNLLIEDKPNQGQFVVLLGLSGCGKSTLLRYISGLQKPSSGDVFIDGKLRKFNGNETIEPISMVFQQYSSLPWMTVYENIEISLKLKNVIKKERHERVMDIIKIVGLEGHENKYAKYPTLSGGQLQRIAIARCLIANPRIVLMDEPFGALDTITRSKMQKLLFDIWMKVEATVVFVTHDLPEAVYLGDDIYIMKSNPGEIVSHIPVKLPIPRDLSIKRSIEFNSILAQVEDELNSFENIK